MPGYSDYIVYVDESGDHSLDSIDEDYPIFVLSCCLFEKSQYSSIVTPAIQNLKFRYFGHDMIVLHENKIRKQVKPFKFLQIIEKRQAFMSDIADIIAEAPFKLIAAVIDKRNLAMRYSSPDNPYEIALKFCMERIYSFLGETEQLDQVTHFVFEKRGKNEDQDLELAFRRICDSDNHWNKVLQCFDIILADKKTNSAGLQLADLTARPIGRHILAPNQKNRAYEIIEPKFRRRDDGKIEGWGLRVFP